MSGQPVASLVGVGLQPLRSARVPDPFDTVAGLYTTTWRRSPPLPDAGHAETGRRFLLLTSNPSRLQSLRSPTVVVADAAAIQWLRASFTFPWDMNNPSSTPSACLVQEENLYFDCFL